MRDETHADSIERWVQYMKTHDDWREIQGEFIDAQFRMHREFLDRVMKQPGGKEKIIKRYGIKNLEGHPSLQ